MTECGIYKADVLRWGLGKNENTGNYQFTLQIRVTGKARDDDDLEQGYDSLDEPLKRTIFMPITAKTKDRVLDELRDCFGYDKPGLQSALLIPGNPDSFDFGKSDVVVECKENDWNGKVTEKWGLVRRKAMKRLVREDQSQFDALFGDPLAETASHPLAS